MNNVFDTSAKAPGSERARNGGLGLPRNRRQLGIGKAAALGLAGRGATVVMVCRNRERGAAARAALMIADLASMAEVREFAAEFLRRYDRIHALVNFELEEAHAARPAHDRALAERLWRVSAELTVLAG